MRRLFPYVLGACLLTIPSGAAGDGLGAQAVSFTHYDCVGPGLPGTAPPHTTHSATVSGFVDDPAKPIAFTIIPLSLFGGKLCPTALNVPPLEHDFTGRYAVQAVCRGTTNDGALFLNLVHDYAAGFPFQQAGGGTACTPSPGGSFSLDVTITISATTFLGVAIEPVGGIEFRLTQE